MSTKAKNLFSATVPNPATEKARREALAVVRGNLARIDAAEATASTTTATAAPEGEVGAVAGSPVPPKPKGKGGRGGKHLKAVAAADQENARARDERAASKDGMTGSERAMAKSAQAKEPKAPKEKKPKKVSGLDAAAIVLAGANEPMNMKQVFAEIQTRKLWTTKGATPEATLYAAVIREIAAKGKESRFKKTDRGLFTANGKGA
jgi:hypothetical protein